MRLSGPMIEALLAIAVQASQRGGWAFQVYPENTVRALERRQLVAFDGWGIVELTAKGRRVVELFGGEGASSPPARALHP